MITPCFEQANCRDTFPTVFGKWWCTNGENNLKCRYMSPIGWKETAYWYNTKEEAERDFLKYENLSAEPDSNVSAEPANDELAAIENRIKIIEKVMELSIEVDKLRAENEELKAEISKRDDYIARTKSFRPMF